jgi:uncharacterized protein with GYD domain
MATFISLVNFTDQGIRSVRESPDRYTAFKATAEKLGVNIKAAFYTVGHFDAVFVAEGSDEAVTAALLKLGSLGNARTETLRAFSIDEMRKIVGSIA